VLYVTKEFDRDYLRGDVGHPMWARDIYRRPRYTREWTFWQYAATGRIGGVDGLIDLDAFHGSRAEFGALIRRP
jgi:lysozyme